MSRKVLLLSIVWGFFIAWAVLAWIATGYVQRPTYQVAGHADGYQVRQYATYLTAQVQLLGPYDQARRQGQRMLAEYVSGQNTLQASIAKSQVIGGTFPVIQESKNDMWQVSFVLPGRYTSGTVPRPSNPRIRLIQTSPQKVAVVPLSGWIDEARIQMAQEKLRRLLVRDSQDILGPFRVVQYSPVWSLPFIRSAEIMVPIR